MKLNLAPIAPTIIFTLFGFGCAQSPVEQPAQDNSIETVASVPRVIDADPNEVHFGELRMLTDGGENAEAYFSFAGDQLIFQSTRPPYDCDQIFTMDLETAETEPRFHRRRSHHLRLFPARRSLGHLCVDPPCEP